MGLYQFQIVSEDWAGADEVCMISSECHHYGCVEMREEVDEPGGSEGNVIRFSHQGLNFVEAERLPVVVPVCLQVKDLREVL